MSKEECVSNKKAILTEKYRCLCEKLKIESQADEKAVNYIIRTSLHEFSKNCHNPAIWCMGKHTRMLMADFMNELKKVHFIIDNHVKYENSGFQIIDEDRVVQSNIDGIIISSFDYKEEIKKTIAMKYPQMKYLDLYEELEKEGIFLQSGYFSVQHPYSRYKVLNQLQGKARVETDVERSIFLWRSILKEYVTIKDFKTALVYADKLLQLTHDREDKVIIQLLQEIYGLEKTMAQEMSEDHVLMLCVDGLRRQDVLNGKMPQLLKWLQEETYFYENACSISTSTYESLIPAYSENSDLRTRYYEENQIPTEKCRFVTEALKQKRKVFFYTDMDRYVRCDEIVRKDYSQTVTEKMWDFILDAADVDNGLFYVHILFESHYSYPNPYTEEPIVADGSNIMFDFLDSKGGGLRTDYIKQQKDALRYLDDVLLPLLSLVNSRIVLYADHGNILLTKEDELEKLNRTKLTFHDDLIQIPLAVKSPERGVGRNKKLISLMELSTIVNCLMRKEIYDYQEKPYIKVLRSAIYNPDFQFLYKKCNYTEGLQAFELFVFPQGYQLAVYADGSVEVLKDDQVWDDAAMRRSLYAKVKDKITVCRVEEMEILK